MFTLNDVLIMFLVLGVALAASFAMWLSARNEARRAAGPADSLAGAIHALNRALTDAAQAADTFEHYASLEADAGNRPDRYFLFHVAEALRPRVDRLAGNPAWQHVVETAEQPRRVWADLEAEAATMRGSNTVH